MNEIILLTGLTIFFIGIIGGALILLCGDKFIQLIKCCKIKWRINLE